MLKNYIYGAHAVLMVYDITNSQSFDNLEDWLAIIRDSCGQKMPALSLVGNKGNFFYTIKIIAMTRIVCTAYLNNSLITDLFPIS